MQCGKKFAKRGTNWVIFLSLDKEKGETIDEDLLSNLRRGRVKTTLAQGHAMPRMINLDKYIAFLPLMDQQIVCMFYKLIYPDE